MCRLRKNIYYAFGLNIGVPSKIGHTTFKAEQNEYLEAITELLIRFGSDKVA